MYAISLLPWGSEEILKKKHANGIGFKLKAGFVISKEKPCLKFKVCNELNCF